MALLAFEDTRSSPVADLMDISQRQKTASELNAAILSSQCQVSAVPCCLLLRPCLHTSTHTFNRKLYGRYSSAKQCTRHTEQNALEAICMHHSQVCHALGLSSVSLE